MAEYITKIRTAQGDKQIDYNALANLPDLSLKANKIQGIYYVEGTGTTDTTNKVATWLGSHDEIVEYYNGLTLAYKIGTAGSTTTTLNINSLGAVTVVKNVSSAISTSYAVDSIVFLVYTTDSGTAYWKVADYDANTRNSVGDYRKNSTKLFFVGTTSSDASTSSSYATSYTNSHIYVTTENVLYSASGFSGDLTGTASQATADSDGNAINTTYLKKAGGTMTGKLIAQNNTSYTTKQVHNMSLYASSATLPTASTSLNGDVILIYE